MFAASIVMWIVSTLHLAALIQRLSLGRTELWEAKAAVSLATLQVGATVPFFLLNHYAKCVIVGSL